MPTYSITAPNGTTYNIEGPAGATRAQVIAKVREANPDVMGASAATPAAPVARQPVDDLLLGEGELVVLLNQIHKEY